MKLQSISLALAFGLLSTSAHSLQGQPDTPILKVQTDIPAGAVSGVWTAAASPFYINGEITIPNDSTLTIEPGVEVVFMGHYKFNVQGRLLALGTQSAWDTPKCSRNRFSRAAISPSPVRCICVLSPHSPAEYK